MRNDGGRRRENDFRTWASGRKDRLEEGVQCAVVWIANEQEGGRGRERGEMDGGGEKGGMVNAI